MRKKTGSRPAGIQGKKEKNARVWIIWRRKRERNGSRGRREAAKRQRAKKNILNPLLFIH